MIRIAFVAYLCLMAALGPALCCCNLRQWLPGSESSLCCGKIGLKTDHGVHHHDGAHSHGKHSHKHDGHSHHHANSTDSASVPANTDSLPQKHDGEECPCGRQDDLIAVGQDSTKVLDLQSHGTFLFAVALPVKLQLDVVDAASIPQVRPALLAGREMLRAYQIMRC